MSFKFKITKISRLPGARVAVLDGELYEGRLTAEANTALVHGDKKIPMRVKAVVFDIPKSKGEVTVSVDLRQPAMRFAKEGDLLVAG